jgi:hypothetical protein
VAKIFQSSKTLVENSARYRGAGCCNLENAGKLRNETEREVNMGLKIWAAGLCAVGIAAMAFSAPPAGAATKKKTVANQSQVVVASRSRRIRVAPRSFLDGGTEVIPGDRKFMDYAVPPGNLAEPLSQIRGTAFNRETALPGPYYLPSRQNPYPWHYCLGC